MACDITVQENLGQDPEVKFTQSGKQVTELRIAATAARKDQNGQWTDDGDPLWVTAAFWGEQHGYLADTLKKGDKVTVTGLPIQRGWDGQQGDPWANAGAPF